MTTDEFGERGFPDLSGCPDSEEPGTMVVDEEGFIRCVNDAFCRHFDWEREQLEGQPLLRLVPGPFRDAHNFGFERFLATGQGGVLDQEVVMPVNIGSGGSRQAKICIHAGKQHGQWRFSATLRPCDQTSGETACLTGV